MNEHESAINDNRRCTSGRDRRQHAWPHVVARIQSIQRVSPGSPAIPRLHDTTGCQSALTTGLTTVLKEQPLFVQRCWTNSRCLFNRLSNRVVQPIWQPAVYTIQPVVKRVCLNTANHCKTPQITTN